MRTGHWRSSRTRCRELWISHQTGAPYNVSGAFGWQHRKSQGSSHGSTLKGSCGSLGGICCFACSSDGDEAVRNMCVFLRSGLVSSLCTQQEPLKGPVVKNACVDFPAVGLSRFFQ